MSPPPYPRIAHLVEGRGTRDDLVLDAAEVGRILAEEVVVEEKLDGANITVFAGPTGYPEVATRGGADSMDRGGQRGPLKAWIAAHQREMAELLAVWPVIYAEWLLTTHSVAYDRLPSYLVVLDLWREGEFAGVDDRDAVVGHAGLIGPPEIWRGTPSSVAAVEALLDRSRWADETAEGLVVRRVGPGEPRLAKLVRPGFDRVSDDEWQKRRPHNHLVAGQASWR